MDIERLAFIFGCILVLIGVIGGGFELKELKIPKVSWPTRLVAIIGGAIFIGMGFFLPAAKEEAKHPAEPAPAGQTAGSPPAPVQQPAPERPPQPPQPATPPPAAEERPAEEPVARPTPVVVKLRWLDNALIYAGFMKSYGQRAELMIDVFDLQTGTFIKTHRQEVRSVPAAGGFVVSGVVNVPGDSVTPYPHSHQFNLVFQNRGGSIVVANCTGSNCYPAEISQ